VRDSDEEATDLGSAQSGIFLRGRLDDPNQIESLNEIEFYAHAIFGRPRRAGGEASAEIDHLAKSLEVGQGIARTGAGLLTAVKIAVAPQFEFLARLLC
jgi:hypothetical protein